MIYIMWLSGTAFSLGFCECEWQKHTNAEKFWRIGIMLAIWPVLLGVAFRDVLDRIGK